MIYFVVLFTSLNVFLQSEIYYESTSELPDDVLKKSMDGYAHVTGTVILS